MLSAWYLKLEGTKLLYKKFLSKYKLILSMYIVL